MTKKEFEESLIVKAWKDSSFKKELLSNPKSALVREGINLPDGLEIKVLEENASTFYLVIPSQPSETGELCEAELESIAGGWKICLEK